MEGEQQKKCIEVLKEYQQRFIDSGEEHGHIALVTWKKMQRASSPKEIKTIAENYLSTITKFPDGSSISAFE